MNITLDQLKQLNSTNSGHFFRQATLAARGETMKDFKIARQNDTHAIVRRKDGATWVFCKNTGRVVFNVDADSVKAKSTSKPKA